MKKLAIIIALLASPCLYAQTNIQGGPIQIGGGAGNSSPLSTKGDLYGYSSVNARIPIGADGQVLTADSAQALGLKWANPAIPTSINGTFGNFTFSGSGVSCSGTTCTFSGGGGSSFITSLTTTGSSGAATVSAGVLNIPIYGGGSSFITSITTTGTSGPATVVSGVLNVPQYVGGVSSVSNSDSTLTITPTTGAVVASLNLAQANTWTAPQTMPSIITNGGGGQGGTFTATEGTAPGAVSGKDILYGDSASHCLMYSANGGAFSCLGAGSGGFPFTLGATPIAASSTTTAVTGLTVDGVTPTTMGFVDPTSSIQTQLGTKAPLASPTFTGTPAAPTATVGTNTTQLASTAFVQAALPTALPPNGTAGGDLSGTYPNPSVAKINAGAFPVSANGVASNSSGQPIPQTAGNIDSILGYTPASQISFTGDFATGVLADYNFSQGTGTTLTDISGANACSGSPCNGTFGAGALAPTWVTGGVFFNAGNQSINLPNGLNGMRTLVASFYAQPLSAGPNGGAINSQDYQPLVTSSLGNTGINFIQGAPSVPGTNGETRFGEYSIYATTPSTNSLNFGTGFHVWEFTLGTSAGDPDHIYLDGQEVPYLGQGHNAGAQTSGNLVIGAANVSPWTGQGMIGTIYRMRIWSTELPASDSVQLYQLMKQDAAQRGIAATPPTYSLGVPLLQCIGDSITAGEGVTTPFCSELSLNSNLPTYKIYNWGVGGSRLQQMTASDQYRAAPYCGTLVGAPTIANVDGGTNDLGAINLSTPAAAAAVVWSNLAAEISILKQAGCLVFVSTMTSKSGSDGGGRSGDADKDAYNSIIRSMAVAAGAAGITDMAASPNLGADGAYANATYFQSGGLHPTQTGTDLMAAEMSNALNYYFGHNAANPNIVTATYSMTASDGYLVTNAASTMTVTLPDCTGQTGAVYTIANPQAANVVTLKTLNSSQTLNGIDYSSTGLVLASNTTISFKDSALPSTTAGCVWYQK